MVSVSRQNALVTDAEAAIQPCQARHYRRAFGLILLFSTLHVVACCRNRLQLHDINAACAVLRRAYLKGWQCLYLHHVKNPNELPGTLESFKTQQFRWCSGPMQVSFCCLCDT